jgi:hypothetical protein
MLAQVYPLGGHAKTATPRPLRPRPQPVEPLFKALLRADEDAVRAACRVVAFDGHGACMNARFGAANALARVWRRLARVRPARVAAGAPALRRRLLAGARSRPRTA